MCSAVNNILYPPSSPMSLSKEEEHRSQHEDGSNEAHTATSPEAAGIVRGASRTMLQSLAKRRIQTSTNTKKAIMTEIQSSHLFSIKNTLKSKNVAQVSDRVAMGMDLVSVAMEQQVHEMNEPTNGLTKDLHEKKVLSKPQLSDSNIMEGNNHRGSFEQPFKWTSYRDSAMNITYSTFCILFQCLYINIGSYNAYIILARLG